MFCTRCGSRTHTAYDCSAPDRKVAPPVEAAPAPEPAESEPPPPTVAKDPVLLRAVHPAWPATCSAEMLPRHDSDKAARKFAEHWCPRVSVKRVWKCESCGGWHFDGRAPSPSGDESGHHRDSRYPREPFVPWRRKAMRESAFGPQPDLPKPEGKPKAEPVKVPRRDAKLDGMLF